LAWDEYKGSRGITFAPGAHRAHIALAALGVPYEEVIIDLDKPREPWYLEVNPRGLVPTISYEGHIFPESAVVSHLLADLYPDKLVAASNTPAGAIERARVEFFVDAFMTKVNSWAFKFHGVKDDAGIQGVADGLVAGAVKEVEPLLKDAKPFFGGRETPGLAEVSSQDDIQTGKGEKKGQGIEKAAIGNQNHDIRS